MKEIIIIETNKPQKLKNFLDKEHFSYKIYQEPINKQKMDIFANYGQAIQIKTVDRLRLIKKLGKLTETEMSEIRKKIDLVFD